LKIALRTLGYLAFSLWGLGAGVAQSAITLENASPATINCRITSAERDTTRSLAIPVGETTSLPARRPVEIQFRSGNQMKRYSLLPDRHFRFLNSTTGQLELRMAPIGAAISSAASAPHWPQLRQIKVVIAGGKEYRAFYRDKWQERARGIVEAAAARFVQQFPIQFRVIGFRTWDYQIAPQTAGEAFERLHKVDLADADLVIGFTMVPFPGPRGEIRGVTQYYSQCVVIPDCWGTTGATTRLVHELCHVFGGFHVNIPDSVMLPGFERTPKTFAFDQATQDVVSLSKDVDFKRGVDSLPPDTQQRIRAIYRSYHHPIENIDEDPIVVGYRYQARRAEWRDDTELSQRMQDAANRLSPPADKPSPVEAGVQIQVRE